MKPASPAVYDSFNVIVLSYIDTAAHSKSDEMNYEGVIRTENPRSSIVS